MRSAKRSGKLEPVTDVSPPPPDPALPEARPRGTRRRFVWRWTRRLLAVVIAVFAAVFVTFFSIDIGQFGDLKSFAEREGSRYLERPLTIGKLVAFVTPGRFAVEDVVIQGVKPTDRPFFRAKRITFEVSWWDLLWRHDLPVNVRLTGWDVFIESWGGGRHNLPKLKPKSSGGKRPFTITVDVEALNGAFAFEDHATPWSVTAPNLTFALTHSRPTNEYVGIAAFSNGSVQIQKFLPMSAAMTTRFVLAGGLVDLTHIDLVTDGARTHVSGAVDFSHWPEQRYNVSSELDFRRMRELFFANEAWDVEGQGEFAGIFHVYNGGQELAGDFKSDRARIQSLEFPDLHGSLRWLPDRFEVTHADADFYGGHTRFTYAIEPLGTPAGATQRFTAEVDDASVASVARLMDLKNLEPTGRIRHAHATMAWPSGKFRTDVQGTDRGRRVAAGRRSARDRGPAGDRRLAAAPAAHPEKGRSQSVRSDEAARPASRRRPSGAHVRRHEPDVRREHGRDADDVLRVQRADGVRAELEHPVSRDEPRLAGERSAAERDHDGRGIDDRRGPARRARHVRRRDDEELQGPAHRRPVQRRHDSGVLHDVGPGLGRRRDRKPLHRRDQRRDRRRPGHGVDSHERALLAGLSASGRPRGSARAHRDPQLAARGIYATASTSTTGRSTGRSRRPTWTSTGPTPGCSGRGACSSSTARPGRSTSTRRPAISRSRATASASIASRWRRAPAG